MTYEEALDIVNELIEDKSMIMEYSDFTAIAYMPLNADERVTKETFRNFLQEQLILGRSYR